jgi:glycosyltransferase involved in cell wall biosynthesis
MFCGGELLQSIDYIVYDLKRWDILFVLLGGGPYYQQALDQVIFHGLQDFVFMPGMIFDKLLLRQYLSTADVLLSPEPLNPLNRHSTFIKVTEYMAMGKPIVAYNLDETKNTAQDAAVYVESGNTNAYGQAIVELLGKPELRYKMGKVGRQRVLERFCWEHQQENLLKAYEATIGHDCVIKQEASS